MRLLAPALPDEPGAALTNNRRLAQNVGFNFISQIVPLAAALVAIPVLIRSLGTARFGVLSLVWGAIGYFNLFDLGIGRALTHSVAARAASRDHRELATTTWTSLAVMTGFGVIGGVLLALLTPPLIGRWLNIPAELSAEARSAFYIMALSLPFALGSTGMRAVMEGFQDFQLSTMLRAPLGVMQFVAPLLVLPFTHALGPVVATLCALRIVAFALHLVVCLVRYPALRQRGAIQPAAVVPLLRYGGWITVSNIVSPLMANMDRFIIGALLPMTAVAYYVTPYELVAKLFVMPGAVLGVLFPAFSTAFAGDRDRAAALVDQGVRSIFAAVLPATLVLIALAHEGLAWWISPEFAGHSAPVLQWLAVGVLINCAGQVAATALQSAGRPDLTGKLNLLELPVYLVLIAVMAKSFGLVGVAIAWTLRVSLDTAMLFVLLGRKCPETRSVVWLAFRVHALAAVLLVGLAALPGTRSRIAGAAFALVVCAIWIWRGVLRREERAVIVRYAGVLRSWRPAGAVSE